MRALSVYSGLGLLDVAAAAAGITVVAMVEPEPFCRKVLASRFPGIPLYQYDMEVTCARLAHDLVLPIDLVFGGPPCQPSSAAGLRLGADDPRWRWPEFCRIVHDLRPRWAVAEQPPNILALHDGEPFYAIVSALSSLGYRVGWGVHGADAVGAPHQRDRLAIVAHLADSHGA